MKVQKNKYNSNTKIHLSKILCTFIKNEEKLNQLSSLPLTTDLQEEKKKKRKKLNF